MCAVGKVYKCVQGGQGQGDAALSAPMPKVAGPGDNSAGTEVCYWFRGDMGSTGHASPTVSKAQLYSAKVR